MRCRLIWAGGGDEDEEDGEKRIDLFASEDGEADPLNKLLMAEDGISTLFMKKGGRVPFRGGGQDASTPSFRRSAKKTKLTEAELSAGVAMTAEQKAARAAVAKAKAS